MTGRLPRGSIAPEYRPPRGTRDPLRPEQGGTLPPGCITPPALRQLADALERLSEWHVAHGGALADAPCLRRVESAGNVDVMAHVSTGPAVGGSWLVLALGRHGWRIVEGDAAGSGLAGAPARKVEIVERVRPGSDPEER